jgi:hypothetical protein
VTEDCITGQLHNRVPKTRLGRSLADDIEEAASKKRPGCPVMCLRPYPSR